MVVVEVRVVEALGAEGVAVFVDVGEGGVVGEWVERRVVFG